MDAKTERIVQPQMNPPSLKAELTGLNEQRSYGGQAADKTRIDCRRPNAHRSPFTFHFSLSHCHPSPLRLCKLLARVRPGPPGSGPGFGGTVLSSGCSLQSLSLSSFPSPVRDMAGYTLN